MSETVIAVGREHLLHMLYEAAELEHNLMCTYLYAAFSLRQGEAEGLTAVEAPIVEGWRRTITQVAIEEMGHLTAVWNLTSALGGTPRFGRGNFPLDPGLLPASIVVRLEPFGDASLQHFVYLERPQGSAEIEGKGFEPEFSFDRSNPKTRLVPIGVNYETVGAFYETLEESLRRFAELQGEAAAFTGDPALQLTSSEVDLKGAESIRCLKTALRALQSIVEQGEGAAQHADESHFSKFALIRAELAQLRAQRPDFEPAFPAAVNPVLRRPFRAQRVWLENDDAVATVDLANAAYGTMLRLLAYSYSIPSGDPEKQLAVDLGVELMHSVAALGARAARLPAGPSHPGCNAGMTFTAPRDAAPFPQGEGARRYFTEQLASFARVSQELAEKGEVRAIAAARGLGSLAERGLRQLSHITNTPRNGPVSSLPLSAAPSSLSAPSSSAARSYAPPAAGALLPQTSAVDTAPAPIPVLVDGVEQIAGRHLTLLFEAQRCIHARHCVTGAPDVFVANVEGPWIHPDAVSTERLVEIAHACPSGAIRYARQDGQVEAAPPVNLIAVREGGPYAVRAELDLAGKTGEYRATLCRCGASKNKPYCDGSHHEIGFLASGEPLSGSTDMLPVRDGTLEVLPQTNGPLRLRGNVEITSGTGRVVARLMQANLCRCGGSANKPFCDGSHLVNGFSAP